MKKKVKIISLSILILSFLLFFNTERYLKNFDYKKVHFYLIDNLSNFINFDFSSNRLEEISFEKKKILLEQFSNNLLRYRFYLAQNKKNILLISKDGVVFFISKQNILNKKKFEIKRIKTNLKELIGRKYVDDYRSVIKGIEIIDENIFVSYLSNTHGCFSNAIAKGKFGLDAIKFSLLVKLKECKKIFNYSVGGNIVKFKNNNLLLSTGDFQVPENLEFQNNKKNKLETDPQNRLSYFGKILMVNIDTAKINIISVGHRNPQGLFYDYDENIIFSTDHGPKGGDEINIDFNPSLKNIKNFGWPKSSYGVRYEEDINFKDKSCENKILTSLAPLCKSHKKFGYTEPAKYFTPSIGITQIIKFINNKKKNIHELMVTSMGYHKHEDDMTIHKIDLDSSFSVVNHEKYYIGERIRDIIQIDDQNFLLALESAPVPSLGLINFSNYK